MVPEYYCDVAVDFVIAVEWAVESAAAAVTDFVGSDF